MAFCVFLCMLLTMFDAVVHGVVNWNLLVILAQVSIIAFANLHIVKKKVAASDYTENSAQSLVSPAPVIVLIVFYAYFAMDEPRWQSYQGVLTVPVLLMLGAMFFYKEPKTD